MDLPQVVAYAAVEGVTRVLPLSATGHRLAAAIWLGDARGGELVADLAQIGCLLALVWAVRARLASAFSEGIRGIARPVMLQRDAGGRDAVAIALGTISAVVCDSVLGAYRSPLLATPYVTALGLLLTAAALGSVSLAPAPRSLCPSALGAVLAGVAHGAAILPGASQVGAAFVVIRWFSVSSWRAAEMALLISIPTLGIEAMKLVAARGGQALHLGAMPLGDIALAVMVAFLCASLAAVWWRALCESSRIAWLGAWLVPLALALIGYGRALPGGP
jgi:undecaprenyl pyrophosphate phosphatase UppP